MHNHMLNTPRPMPRWRPPAGAERGEFPPPSKILPHDVV